MSDELARQLNHIMDRTIRLRKHDTEQAWALAVTDVLAIVQREVAAAERRAITDVDDPALSIDRMFSKMDGEDKQTFNMLIRWAINEGRRRAEEPRDG